MRIPHPRSGQGKKNFLGAMGVALCEVVNNGPFIVGSGTEFGAVKHETITNGITPCLQPSKWRKSAL